MGAEHPSLQQRDHAMNAGKQVLSFRWMALNLAIVDISVHPQIGGQTVGSDRASGHDSLGDESVQAGLGHVWNAAKTNASDAFSIFLGGDDNQGLEFCPPTD
jgi:hypothetical protein